MSDQLGGSLEGRTAVVTGGASGLGRATSELLASRGVSVLIGDLDLAAAENVAAAIEVQGGRAAATELNVVDEDSVRDCIDLAVATFGALDILVANAGVAEQKAPLHIQEAEAWQRILDINLMGVMLTNKYALQHMVQAGSGSVINVSSILGLVGQANSGPYSASKAAVTNLTRSAGLTYASQGIRVNAVAPGYAHTPLLAKLPQELRDQMAKLQPIGRLAESVEIARVIAFLASDEASFIVGATIPVDGGYTAV